jgi:hypothetical protein
MSAARISGALRIFGAKWAVHASVVDTKLVGAKLADGVSHVRKRHGSHDAPHSAER